MFSLGIIAKCMSLEHKCTIKINNCTRHVYFISTYILKLKSGLATMALVVCVPKFNIASTIDTLSI